ncbi:hypothetical protein BPNPMPFG_007208 (plasmid) [Mesorhizobium sp. AR07]|uniref:hypothetical protein n=1 Tax=Mesorhizobium sp. AR07 TaxID=2865838 RepID=UPI002160A00B|nr:hypothetical protein [Mesorhizobium sp. AR07]UVK49313.1 hypothetical protein BPNPMPFG_007208 [Mesorhizobium sp. AR07]
MSGANASTASAVSGTTPGMVCSRRTVPTRDADVQCDAVPERSAFDGQMERIDLSGHGTSRQSMLIGPSDADLSWSRPTALEDAGCRFYPYLFLADFIEQQICHTARGIPHAPTSLPSILKILIAA